MNIEIIAFYPTFRDDAKKTLIGSLHVRLSDLGIDIRGVYVSKKKDFWHISMPHKTGVHHETQESVRYPVISFVDSEMHKAIMQMIRTEGMAFIEKQLEANTQATAQQTPEAKRAPPAAQTLKGEARAPAMPQKNQAAPVMQSPRLTIKEWSNPPKRPQNKFQRGGFK